MAELTPADRNRPQPVPLIPMPDRDRIGLALPTPLTTFVGREREVAAVADMLRREDARLITLTGPAGVGKTRLALRVAEQLASDFGDGVVFVSLADLGDPGLVVTTIAQALGIRDGSGQPLAARLARALRDRHLLLVLDNLEHLLEAAPLVTDLLSSCPRLTVVVTSRAVLRVSGEHDYPVPPMVLPDPLAPPERLANFEAVRLFVTRAQAADPSFGLTPDNAPTVAVICHRLDGLPLAIELAAAKTRMLTPPALLGRLDRQLRVLTGGARDQPPRMQTMRNAIAWSHDLLVPEERALFHALAVFVGGFTLEAVAAIISESGDSQLDVFAGVTALVEQSLVHRLEPVAGEPRFGMLEMVLEYAEEQLEASEERAVVRDAHARYFQRLVDLAEPAMDGPEQGTWLARLQAEHANLRAALTWLEDTGQVAALARLAVACTKYWYRGGHPREGHAWIEKVLNRADLVTPEVLRSATLWAGEFAFVGGDLQEVAVRGRQCQELYQASGDLGGLARALHLLGLAAEHGQRLEEASSLFMEELQLCVRLGNNHGAAVTRCLLGGIAYAQADLARAAAFVEEALTLFRIVGDRRWTGLALWYLGQFAVARSRQAEAAAHFSESLRLLMEVGDRFWIAKPVAGLAGVAGSSGLAEPAAQLLGAVDTLLAASGSYVMPFDRPNLQRAEVGARARLDGADYAAAYQAGRALNLVDLLTVARIVIAVTQGGDQPAPPPEEGALSKLTPRELDVLRLLAEGRSDREIADSLFLSYRTVTSYVTSILGKLDVDSRTAAATYAVRHGLV